MREIGLEDLTFDSHGVRIHAKASGPAGGPVVILLHGFPEFWYGWKKQIPVLAEAGYRVIVPDQRGYGWSDKPAHISDYSVDRLAGDVVAILDALEVKKAFVAGHDWGAAVTWWLAVAHADRVEAAAVLNVPHMRVMQKFLLTRLGQLLKSWYIFFFQLPWLPEWVVSKNDFSFAVRSLLGSSRKGTFTRQDLEEYKKAWAQPGAFRAMIHWYRAALRHPPRVAQGFDWKVRIPLLMVWGEADRFLSKEMAKASLEYCTQGRLVSWPGVSHWVQHEEPEKVAQLLIEHFVSA